MKLLLLILFFLSLNVGARCGKVSRNFCNVKVVDLYDGDTFYINLPKVPSLLGKRLGIRVKGIDTPEIRGGSAYEKAMAKKAKIFTKKMLDGARKVDLKSCVRGKYFRIVCNVYIDGKSLAKALVRNGLAVKYKG